MAINTKPFFRFIDSRFYWQDLIEVAVAEKRRKTPSYQKINYVIIPGKYCKIKIDKPEEVLEAIKAIYELYNEKTEGGKLIRARYGDKEKPDITISRLGISKQTYYNWLNSVIAEAACDFVKRDVADFRNFRF